MTPDNTKVMYDDKDMRAEDRADRNEDPITHEPGSHPVGTGIGTAAGGAAAGALGGAVAGPIGAAVGAVVGGVAGAFAGKGVAEAIDPTVEEAYWRENHANQEFADRNDPANYDAYAPAYRVGYTGYERDANFHDAEPRLRQRYEQENANPPLGWDAARPAALAAWDHVDYNLANPDQREDEPAPTNPRADDAHPNLHA